MALALLFFFGGSAELREATGKCGPGEASTELVENAKDWRGAWYVDKFATHEECKELMELTLPHLTPQENPSAVGLSYELPVEETSGVLQKRVLSLFPEMKFTSPATIRMRRYLTKPDGLLGLADEFEIWARIEDPDVAWVKAGSREGGLGADWHPRHTDYWDKEYQRTHRGVLWSLMLYLNTPHPTEENGEQTGGETYFTVVDGTIKPVMGRLAIWRTCLDGDHVDPLSEHQGNPIKPAFASHHPFGKMNMKFTALWLFWGDPRVACVPNHEPLPCVQVPEWVSDVSPLDVLSEQEQLEARLASPDHWVFWAMPPGIGHDRTTGLTYYDCSKVNSKSPVEAFRECSDLGLLLANSRVQLPATRPDDSWLALEADHQTIQYALLTGFEAPNARVVEWWNSGSQFRRDAILDRIRVLQQEEAGEGVGPRSTEEIEARRLEETSQSSFLLPDHRKWKGMMFSRAIPFRRWQTDGHFKRFTVANYDAKREHEKGTQGLCEYMWLDCHVFENRLHKINTAKVFLADYEALDRDFGRAVICPDNDQSKPCPKEIVNAWLLDNVAFLSDAHYRAISSAEFNGEPLVKEGTFSGPVPNKIALRPPNFGRTMQIPVGDFNLDEFRKGNLKAFEVKGSGITEQALKDHLPHHHITYPLYGQYSSGTISLSKATREFTHHATLKKILDVEEEAPFKVVPVYAVIDVGYDIPKFGVSKDVTRVGENHRFEETKHTRGALLVRGATLRGSEDELENADSQPIDKVTRKYGLSSKLWNFEKAQTNIKDRAKFEFKRHANIQSDWTKKLVTDLDEWIFGEPWQSL